MDHVYLEKRQPAVNMHRFYQMFITPGLLGEWSLVREWGRVGSPGTVRKDWFESEADAVAAGQKLLEAKLKKGYLAKREGNYRK